MKNILFIGLMVDDGIMPVKEVESYTEAIELSSELNTKYGDYYLIDMANNSKFIINNGELNSNKLNFMNENIKVEINCDSYKNRSVWSDIANGRK